MTTPTITDPATEPVPCIECGAQTAGAVAFSPLCDRCYLAEMAAEREA